MQPIRVAKAELRRILVEKREAHSAAWHEALVGFERELAERLEKELASLRNGDLAQRIRSGEAAQVLIHEQAPENHVAEYDLAIQMLDIAKDEEIVLNEQDVRKYVQDEWAWKSQWAAVTSKYMGRTL